jgi:hypothetical protein
MMANGRIGGSLVIVGIATFLVAVWLGLGGVPTYSVGSDGLGTTGGPVVTILAVALGLVGVGSLFLGSGNAFLGVGDPPFERGATRYGLRILAVGLLLFSLGFASTGGLRGSAVDALIIPLVGGSLALVVGAVTLAASLLSTPGLSRAVGGMFATGFVVAFFGNGARETGPFIWSTAVAMIVVGSVLMLLGWIGLGVLGIRGPSVPAQAKSQPHPRVAAVSARRRSRRRS